MSENQSSGYMTQKYVNWKFSSKSGALNLIEKFMKDSNKSTPKEDEKMRSYFVNEALGIRRMILDKEGNIQNFPGIEAEDFWVKELKSTSLLSEPQVMAAEFCRVDGDLLMIWHFQEDSRAYDNPYTIPRDPCLGIKLYSTLDDSGNFMHPFRIYSMQTESGTEKVYR